MAAGAGEARAALRLGAARLRFATFFFGAALRLTADFLAAPRLPADFRAALRLTVDFRAALRFTDFFFLAADFLLAALVPRFAVLRAALRFFVFAIPVLRYDSSGPAPPPTKRETHQGAQERSCLHNRTGTRHDDHINHKHRQA
jgi:hypothetical protein